MASYIIIGIHDRLLAYLRQYITDDEIVNQPDSLLELGDDLFKKIRLAVDASAAVLLVLRAGWQDDHWWHQETDACFVALKAALQASKPVVILSDERLNSADNFPEEFSALQTAPFVELNARLLKHESVILINQIFHVAGQPEVAGLSGSDGASDVVAIDAEATDAYISYAPEDRAFARSFSDALASRNFIVSGDEAAALDEIEMAHSFIFMVSAASIRSPYCQQQLRHAIVTNRRIFPVIADDQITNLPDAVALVGSALQHVSVASQRFGQAERLDDIESDEDGAVASSAQSNDIFISYSRRNSTFVHGLVDRLGKKGFTIWADWEDIPPSAQWMREIYAGIESAHTFVFVVSQDSLSSKICQFELRHAIQARRRIIPVIYENPTDMIPGNDGSDEPRYDLAFDELGKRPLTLFDRVELGDEDIVAMARRHYANEIEGKNWIFFDRIYDFDASFETLNLALEADLDTMQLFNRLYTRSREWKASDHNDGLLLRGAALREARSWVESGKRGQGNRPQSLTARYENEFNFIEELVDASKRAQQRRGVLTFGMIAVTVAVIVVAAYIALTQTDQRLRVEDVAASQSLVGQANTLYGEGNHVEAFSYAAEAALLEDPPADVRRTLSLMAYQPGIRRAYFDQETTRIAAYSPDGERLYALDENIVEWDAKTGQPLRRLFANYIFPREIIVHPDGQHLLVLADDRLDIWDIDSGMVERTFDSVELGLYLDISVDGKTVVVTFVNEAMLLIDFESLEVLHIVDNHYSYITDIAVSNNGVVYSLGNDNRLVLTDIITGQMIRAYELSHTFTTVLAGPDDATAFLSGGGVIASFDRVTGEIDEMVLDVAGDVFAVDRSFTIGAYLAEGRIHAVDLRTWEKLYEGVLDSNFRRIETAPMDHHFLLSDGSLEMQLWDFSDEGLVVSFRLPGETINVLVFSQDESVLAVGTGRGTVVLWDLQSGEELERFDAGAGIQNMALNLDLGLVATIDDDEQVAVRSLDSGQVHQFELDTFITPKVLDISLDGERLVVGSESANTVWDIETGERLNSLQSSDNSMWPLDYIRLFDVLDFGFADLVSYGVQNDQYIVGGTAGVSFYEFDVITRSLGTAELPGVALSVAISPDGQTGFAVLDSGRVLVVEAATRQIVQQSEIMYPGVTASAFVSGGSLHATGHADGTVQLRRIIVGYDNLLDWIRHNRFVKPLDCFASGRFVRLRECDEPLALVPSPQPTLARQPFNSPTPESQGPVRTPTPTSLPATAVASILSNVELAELSFSIRIPEHSDFVVDRHAIFPNDDADYMDRALFYPGDRYLEIYYDEVEDGSVAFLLAQSTSPHATLDEWRETYDDDVRVSYGTVAGQDYAYNIEDNSILVFFIYDGTFVSMFGLTRDVSLEQLEAMIESYTVDGR